MIAPIDYINIIKNIYSKKDIDNLFDPRGNYKFDKIIDLLNNKENVIWLNSWIKNNNEVISFYSQGLQENKIEINNCFLPFDFEEINEYKFIYKSDSYFPEFLGRLILLFLYQETLIVKGETIIDSIVFKKDQKVKEKYYRGQADASWKLIPSFYRNLNKNVLVDVNFLNGRYHELDLLGKYMAYIKVEPDNIYDMIAFMQHSCSYSPFLDFSKNLLVAKSFAICKSGNLNDYANTDSVVIELNVYENEYENIKILKNETEIDSFLKNEFMIYNIQNMNILDLLTKGISFDVMDSSMRIKKEKIRITTIPELIELLTPKFAIIDKQTNDRMKYQKGVFIVFYDCICIKNRILYEFSKDFLINRNIIKSCDKPKEIEDLFKNNRTITLDYLLDPYKVFRE